MHEGSESGYVHGCRCANCLKAHAATQRAWRAKKKIETDALKLELEQLRAWRDQMLASAPSGEPVAR